jgi:glycogen operon protein
MRRNLLASLMLAQGVPLLLAGDEVGNSQNGNNNAYCQDNPTGWVNWSGLGGADDNIAFVAQLTELRRHFAQLRPRRWVEGRRPDGSFGVLWPTPQATEMTQQDWNFPGGRFLSYVLAAPERGEAALYIVLNGATEAIAFILPDLDGCRRWTTLLDTASEQQPGKEFAVGPQLQAWPRSVLAFSGAA